MKICHIIYSLTKGGAELMLKDIINEQSTKEKVHLVVINDRVDKNVITDISSKVKIHLINRNPGSRNPLPIINLNFELMKINPDIIHCHNPSAIKLVAIRFYTKTILTVHSIKKSVKDLHKYNKIIAISESVKEIMESRSKVKLKTIYNGIKFDRVKTKQNLLNYGNTLRMIQISRLVHKIKGQHVLIQAAERLKDELGFSNFSIDFIGKGSSEQYLKDLVKQLNLKRHISFLGEKKRSFIYNHLCEYDLLVHPAIYEGFGLTVIEAMAAKVPVLVSNIHGPMEIIKKGKYGNYFKNKDPDDCAQTILEIFNNLGKVQKVQKEVYNYAKNNYSIKIVANKYINLYKDVL